MVAVIPKLHTAKKKKCVSHFYPAVIHFGIKACPFVLQYAQVLLGLGGTRSRLVSSTSEQHRLSLIKQTMVLICSLSQLGLKLLQKE